MTKLFLFLCFGLVLNGHCTEDPEFSLVGQKTIHQFQEGLWGVEIEKGLYGVVEQVTDKNRDSWLKYFEVQSGDRVVSAAANYKGSIQKGRLSDGAIYAQNALNDTNRLNQNYIVYITRNPVLKPTDEYSYRHYSAAHIQEVHYGVWATGKENVEHWLEKRDAEDFLPFQGHPIARDIKMYVTITTSPEALITSHMGIAATAESIFTGRPEKLSPTLHALGARVMQIIDPRKQYMLTVPVHHVTMLLSKVLPDNLFYGTVEEKIYFDEAVGTKNGMQLDTINFGVNRGLPLSCKDPAVLEALKAFWEKHPPRVSVGMPEPSRFTRSRSFDLRRPRDHLRILSKDGHPSLEIRKEDTTYDWLFNSRPMTSDLQNRYVLIPLGALSSLFPLPERHLARDGAHSPTAEGGGGSGAGGAGYEKGLA